MKPSTALVAAITAVLVSACAAHDSAGPAAHDQGGASSSAAAVVNDAADVTFATDMIPHHQQAVAMAGLVPSRSSNPAVVTLASKIAAAQGPEIETMRSFLAQWGHADAGHQDMPGMQMQGMVDDATMTRLESLRGQEFDTLFLQSMIGHHEGAIAMAKTELANGANADAKNLAQQIVTAQQAEIDQMQQMLKG
jgi:uncharacterized protein (DUF305 family)